MAELKTAPKVDYFYDPSEWEYTTDDPDLITDNAEGVMEVATLFEGPRYFAFVDDNDEETRWFEFPGEAKAAFKKMVGEQDAEE